MKTEVYFLLKDLDCETALRVLFEKQIVSEWLKNYQSLYQSIVIAPEGLPAVVQAHNDDRFYEFIFLFGQTYQSLMECQTKLKK
jgi:hypothetical protein